MRRLWLAVLVIGVSIELWPAHAAGIESPEYLVVGTVVWTNPGTSAISIRGTGLIGPLRLKVKSFRVKERGALIQLHPGDRITAVYSESDGMLHRLRRILRRKPS